MDSQKAHILLGVLQHQFDVYLETINDMNKSHEYSKITRMLDTLDAVIEGIISFGGDGYGDYYNADDLERVISEIPDEVYFNSTIKDRFDDEYDT